MLPIGRATFEFEEFLAACEDDLGCSPDTVSFYRKKVTRFLAWAQREKVETLDAHAVRQFFRSLKDQGVSDNGRHTYLRALQTWFNFLVRRKVVRQSPLVDADLRIRAVGLRPELPRADRLHRLLQQMKTDVFPPGAKAPDFVRLRDYALVLWYIETGARLAIRLDDISPEPKQFGDHASLRRHGGGGTGRGALLGATPPSVPPAAARAVQLAMQSAIAKEWEAKGPSGS